MPQSQRTEEQESKEKNWSKKGGVSLSLVSILGKGFWRWIQKLLQGSEIPRRWSIPRGLLRLKPQLESIIKTIVVRNSQKLRSSVVVLVTKKCLLQPRKCWLPQIQANHALKMSLLGVKFGVRLKGQPQVCLLAMLLDSGWLLRSHSHSSRVFPLEPWQLSRDCGSYGGQRETPWVPTLQARGKSQNKDLAPTDKSKDTRPEIRKRRVTRDAGSGNSEGKITLPRPRASQRPLWTIPSDYCHRKEFLWIATYRKEWVAFDSGCSLRTET